MVAMSWVHCEGVAVVATDASWKAGVKLEAAATEAAGTNIIGVARTDGASGGVVIAGCVWSC